MTGEPTLLPLPSEKPPRGAAYDYAVRMGVIALAGQGLSSHAISERTGIDASVIRRWLRRYREYGQCSLQPYWRPTCRESSRSALCANKDLLFQEAYEAYVKSRESVASITRRFNLNYHSFKYYVERYHPELVAARARTRAKQRLHQ